MSRRILAVGSGFNQPLIRKFAHLTGKSQPKICLLPTATGDHPKWIRAWETFMDKLGLASHVMPLFISSFEQKQPFAGILLTMDAIYVGGGNTLNMLAVWRAQGIDVILRRAYENGILLGGGSAGGICWFENGLTDSRPVELTAMKALGWLEGSLAPHYLAEPGRRAYYHKYLLDGSLSSGYGIDDSVALLFENERMVSVLGSKGDATGFKVTLKNGLVHEEKLGLDEVVSQL